MPKGLEQFQPAVAVGLSVVHPSGPGQVVLPTGITPEIAEHQIHAPVPIAVDGLNRVPPTAQTLESPLTGPIHRKPLNPSIHFRTPQITSQHQLRVPIPIEIREHGPADQACRTEHLIGGRMGFPSVTFTDPKR